MSTTTRSIVRVLAICALLLSALTQAQNNLQPAGLAVYTDTSRDIYLAALLTPEGTLPAALDKVAGPIAMEYRIATRRISTRGLSGTMLLQAELGSGQRAPNAVIDALEKFKGAVHDSLVQGDIVRVSLTADGETIFRVDGTELFRVPDAQVFQYLLLGWVGDSSSALLRDSLLAGKLAPGLSSQFDALQPSATRSAQVATWTQESAEAQLAAAEEAEKAKEKEKEKEKEQANAKEEAKPAVPGSAPTIAAVKPEVPAPGIAPETAPAATSDKPAAKAGDEAQAAAANTVATAPQAPATDAKTEGAKPPAKPATQPQQLAMQGAGAAQAATDLDDREYQRQVAQYLAKVNSKVSSAVVYPRLAVSRSWEGTVALLIELNEDGEVQNIITDSPSGHKVLDKAAVKAVENSASFPKLNIVAREEFAAGDGRYQVPVSVRFKLN